MAAWIIASRIGIFGFVAGHSERTGGCLDRLVHVLHRFMDGRSSTSTSSVASQHPCATSGQIGFVSQKPA